MSPNTSTALFTFTKDQGGLQIKLPRAIICLAVWSHLTRCCQFDDRTRQLAEIIHKDALEKYGCLDMEDLQLEAEFLTWDQASQNSFRIRMPPDEYTRNQSKLGSIEPGLDSFSGKYRSSTGYDNHPTPGPHTIQK